MSDFDITPEEEAALVAARRRIEHYPALLAERDALGETLAAARWVAEHSREHAVKTRKSVKPCPHCGGMLLAVGRVLPVENQPVTG